MNWHYLLLAILIAAGWHGQAAEWSFKYGGKRAEFALKAAKTIADDARHTRVEETYVAPDGALELRVTRTKYKRFAAQEYRPELVAVAEQPTEIVSDFWSFDSVIAGEGGVGIRALTGTKNTQDDFTPKTVKVGNGIGQEKSFSMVATEGASSVDWMPFFGVDFADGSGREFAVGWSGAWRADFAVTNGGVRLSVGMLKTNFRLLPGERLRMPSMLIFDRAKAVSATAMKTTIHRFMIDEKAPRDARGNLLKPLLPLSAGGGNKSPETMKRIIGWKAKEKMPFDCFWIDAGWNGAPHLPDEVLNCGRDWWRFVGDWRVNRAVHTAGNLAEIADAAHADGMKMLLWMEPERCRLKPIKQPITQAHRDWFLPVAGKEYTIADNSGVLMLNLGNDAACDYLIELVSKVVRENKLDVYRQDMNFKTLPYWCEHDAPDRIGVTEAKYIMGLYRFWDALRERFPDLLIENCAAGGRRLDFELISRSHSYCRTDYVVGFKGNAAQITDAQNCSYNTLAYQPFQGSETSSASMFDDYGIFSTMCAATVFTPPDWQGALLSRDFTAEENAWLNEVFTAADRMRPYYEGDFYPLCGEPRQQSEREWCAWQMHRADLGAGFAIVFRRVSVAEYRFECQLGGIDAEAEYEVEFFRGEKRRMTGGELEALAVDIKRPRDFRLFFYNKVTTDRK